MAVFEKKKYFILIEILLDRSKINKARSITIKIGQSKE